MALQGPKYSPQKSRPLESGHRRHGVCIAIECSSYKLDQKNEFKFLCELCTFSQIRSHILRGSCKLPIPPILRESFKLATPVSILLFYHETSCARSLYMDYETSRLDLLLVILYNVASANSTRVLQQEFLLGISTEPNCVVHS